MNHSDVVTAFRQGRDRRGHNVFARNRVLYSYGDHFPLAIERSEESNLKDGSTWYLLNGDKYSVTTSQHQSMTFGEFSEFPRVSFRAIHAGRIDPFACTIIDWWQDSQRSINHDDPGFDTFQVPSGATYSETSGKHWGCPEIEVYSKSWHRVGSAILKQGEKQFICSMDEGSYFVSELPCKVQSMAEGFESLKPDPIKLWESRGIPFIRQGEWFFIPAGKELTTRTYSHPFILPNADSRSNQHIATMGKQIGDMMLVAGRVRHVDPVTNHATREHRTVVFPEKTVWQAFVNTAVNSWSGFGSVD